MFTIVIILITLNFEHQIDYELDSISINCSTHILYRYSDIRLLCVDVRSRELLDILKFHCS